MLRRTEELDLLRTAIDAASVLIVEIAEDGCICGINSGVARLTGMSGETACGRAIWELPACANERTALENCFSDGQPPPSRVQFHLPSITGAPRLVDWSVRHVRGANEASAATILVGIDPPERFEGTPTVQRSKARLRRFVESNIIGMVVWDEAGRVTEANEAFLRLVGFTRDELLSGKVSWQAITPPEYRALDDRALAEVRVRGVCTPFEKEYIAKDGSRVPVLVGGSRLEDSPSDFLTGVGFIVDLREHVHLRKVRDQLLTDEQRARVETEIANARLLLLVEGSKRLSRTVRSIETLQTLTEVVIPGLADWSCVVHRQPNGGASVVASAHGDPNKRLLLQRLHGARVDLLAPEGASRVFRTGETVFSDEITTEQLSVRPGSWALISLLDAEDQVLLGQIGMRSLLCVPISGRAGVDAVLMLASETNPHRYDHDDAVLASDLAGRAATGLENSRLLSEALESVRARDDFLAVAAHELRTPLTSLLLQIQILERALDRAQLDPASTRRSIRAAETQARRLAALVDGLLDVARLASNRMTIRVEDVDLRQVLNELETALAADLEKAGCCLELSAPDHIFGRWDRMRIEQVLTNLLTNAMKFGAGHPIRVEVESTPANVRVSVRDHGIGISGEDQDRIFDRFERAVSSRHFGGLGLGLYISVQILRAHRGSLRVESTPGRGACFIIELPSNFDPLSTTTEQPTLSPASRATDENAGSLHPTL
jgi:PAS domain S-box-containing protein